MTATPATFPVAEILTLETISIVLAILVPIAGAFFTLGVLYSRLQHQREELTRLRDTELTEIKNKLVELETKLGTYLNSLQEYKELWKEERSKKT